MKKKLNHEEINLTFLQNADTENKVRTQLNSEF